MVDVNVRHQTRVYQVVRMAILNLGATAKELQRYQPLLQEHMRVMTARINPFLWSQWDMGLAWFWTVDVQRDIDQEQGMVKCE